MRKLLILLLFVSFNSFGQSYYDIMSMKDLSSFQRVMIENGFQYDSKQSNENQKWYNALDETKGGLYDSSIGMFSLYFSKTRLLGGVADDTPYDEIYERVKKLCTFAKIHSIENLDYACYKCNDAQFEGYIGFTVAEGSGLIMNTVIE